MCINAYIYIYIYTCLYIHIYMSAHIHTYTYTHTHIQNVHMHAHKNAWNNGAAATARGADADTRPCTSPSFNAITIFSTSNAGTLLYLLPETPIPLNPPFSIPNIPKNRSRTAGKREFTVPHWSDEDIGLKKLNNCPLRSCRKIRWKTAVQQSPSRWARRHPSLRMTNVTTTE